jgi:hypothetical protein
LRRGGGRRSNCGGRGSLLGLWRLFALGEQIADHIVHTYRRAFVDRVVKNAVRSGFKFVIQFFGLDFRDKFALDDGFALPFSPSCNDTFCHEVAESGHYNLDCHFS